MQRHFFAALLAALTLALSACTSGSIFMGGSELRARLDQLGHSASAERAGNHAAAMNIAGVIIDKIETLDQKVDALAAPVARAKSRRGAAPVVMSAPAPVTPAVSSPTDDRLEKLAKLETLQLQQTQAQRRQERSDLKTNLETDPRVSEVSLTEASGGEDDLYSFVVGDTMQVLFRSPADPAADASWVLYERPATTEARTRFRQIEAKDVKDPVRKNWIKAFSVREDKPMPGAPPLDVIKALVDLAHMEAVKITSAP